MKQAIQLRLHRWLTLVFALPLAVVVVTGLILSAQPIVQTASVRPGSLTAEKLESLVARHDPEGKARGLSINAYDNILTLAGVGPDGEIDVDLSTGAEAEQDTPLSDWFSWSRRVHQRLIGGMGWLVIASTFAMLALVALGVLMGLPRLRNTVSGWHKGVAWFTLPLVIISPLTGLFLAWGVGQTGGPAPGAARGPRQAPLPLVEAVRTVAANRDPSTIVSIGVRGGRLMARLNEGGELRGYAVTREGVTPLPRNWSRLVHEGNWMGWLSGGINVLTSLAIIALMGTGLTIWARRAFRRRKPRATHQIAAPAE